MLLPDSYAVCRLPSGAWSPHFTEFQAFVSITRTADELSIVCRESEALRLKAARRETGWRVLQVAGPLDFALTGVLAALLAPLASMGISVFTISTFDTDYILVREVDLERAMSGLQAENHTVKW